jgi:hypothetical protein
MSKRWNVQQQRVPAVAASQQGNIKIVTSENLGMDRHFKSNTVKARSHSLFRQSCMLYDLIPNMPEHRLRSFVERFAEMLQQSRVMTEAFSIV